MPVSDPAVAWLLTAAFAALAWPPLARLSRGAVPLPRPESPGHAPVASAAELPAPSPSRSDSLAELVLCAAMVAMTSPIGAPIPAAGWQAVLLVTLVWSLVTRRHHHLAATATMLFMLTAMPHHSGDHGPWLTMPAMGRGWWTPITLAAAAWFLLEAAHAVSSRGTDPSRKLSRTGMSLGMACALVMSA
ncbi:DUF5134 domain-containing protein [Amycolatopsis rhabdoformis]|uniref:DUF5134 domain-containing protein n=1 Tax=Amycolatopsis rhabdoformis TaxID=1448059 RepID=A0ABZ1I046_9PSEU|nr:DUF5134 domain-containing protein [Amycolatopsis rhabdoformis]WSE27168.1 DUF5134 domain-containing protein [Amycolatopsis rhabdoformis]